MPEPGGQGGAIETIDGDYRSRDIGPLRGLAGGTGERGRIHGQNPWQPERGWFGLESGAFQARGNLSFIEAEERKKTLKFRLRGACAYEPHDHHDPGSRNGSVGRTGVHPYRRHAQGSDLDDVLSEAKNGGYRIIATTDLGAAYSKNPNEFFLVDTRQEWEYRTGYISGAISFPMEPTWWSRWRKADA